MELISSSAGGHAGNTQKYPHTHTHTRERRKIKRTDGCACEHTHGRTADLQSVSTPSFSSNVSV